MDLELEAAMFMFGSIRKCCISLKSITVFSSSENETKRFGGKTREKQTTWKIYIYIYIQGVPGGMDKTSGECSLC